MTQQNPTNIIEVERDGLKLGWNVLAIVAALGLGLYVTSIVAPMKDAIIASKAETIELKASHAEHVKDYTLHDKEMRKRVTILEEKLK